MRSCLDLAIYLFIYLNSIRYGPGNGLVGQSNLVVPFVACGDLSGFDADKSYPLRLTPEDSDYVYVEPIQPPIHPNYETFKHRQQRSNPDLEV